MNDDTIPYDRDDLGPLSRLEALIDAYLQGDIDEAERRELSRSLLASPAARAVFWEMARFSSGLERWAGETWGEMAAHEQREASRHDARSAAGASSHPVRARSARYGWRRPMAASLIAAIIVSGLLGAGVAWAISLPARSRSAVRLMLANQSFEADAVGMAVPSAAAARMEHLPDRFGVWGADHVRICGGENGVMPADGRKMLAFVRALPGPGDPTISTADSCDLYQLIDLTTHAALIAQGGCMLRLTAKVCDASGPHEVQSLFVGRLSVYDRPLGDILPAWPASRSWAASEAAERLLSSGDADRWQQVSATVSLPAASRFAIVQIDATTMDRTPGRGAATFDRHYCDDVRVTLLLPERGP